MDHSQYVVKAEKMIQSVKGTPLSTEERREKSIELASYLLQEARRVQTHKERKIQNQVGRMLKDPKGKVFTVRMADQCFRSSNYARVFDQCLYLLNKYGVPSFLSYSKQLQLSSLKWMNKGMASLIVPLIRRGIRQETKSVIIPGDPSALSSHIHKRRKDDVRLNINHIGEAILGEEEAMSRLRIYLKDLENPDINYVSVKISTIASQLNLLAWDETLSVLEERLKQLYRAAKKNTFVRPDGKRVAKFVNLDMEEYRDLHLTVDLFRRVLDQPEFFQYSAGIVLQSYLPDSHLIQQELTVWAMKRVANGGAPVSMRLVKGANLAMEKVDASIHNWPQAPYKTKADVDSNFKRMINYGFKKEHAKAVRIGVASHNLFDIAYAMLLRAENEVEPYVGFEMLEGMADHMRRVVQDLAGDLLLYCPVSTKQEFQYAFAYLVRRLDENTQKENFLCHLFDMLPGTSEWQTQANYFSFACHASDAVSVSPRRTQNRFLDIEMPEIQSPFVNEPDTDFGLEQNRKWAVSILKEWKEREFDQIPLVIGSKEYRTEERSAVEKDPSRPNHDLYRYTLATPEQADQAITVATEAQESWGSVSLQERSKILADVAQEMRLHRGELIGAMIADTGKLIPEADTEISEAIDFLEYYRRSAEEFHAMNDLNWSPIGPVVITPPWNFPCAIPVGGIAAALAAGNTVIFKPSREAILVGWTLVQRFWEAGVPKNVLQFVTGKGSEIGDNLIKDERVKCIILTGATETAKMMLKKRPSLHLMAETGGKNAIIVTSLSDRDLAVNHILQSAFFHGGQKCSACSLLILEKEVYEDPHFRGQLYDGLSSLKVGSAWDLQSKINPLIHIPDETLARGLTTLDEGEKWLIQPKQDDNNPNLWTPGIKFGVTEKSFTYHNELFGPVLSVMCANNLEHAIQLANGTKYGLTSGIFSLDQREIEQWEKSIEVGNAYINRGVTGAIVRRQPFGGCKESSFGRTTKAGGPNYLLSLMDPTEKTLPKEHAEITSPLKILSLELKKTGVTTECFEKWEASIKSYLYHYAHYFSKDHDPSQVVGQDNILRYLPRKRMGFRVQEDDSLSDIMRVLAASKVCNTPIVVSGNLEQVELIASADWLSVFSNVTVIAESESEFVDRLKSCGLTHIRLISEPSDALLSGLAENSVNAILTPVCSNGRVELVHYLREMAISRDYHRYGNLGVREDEERSPVL